MLKKNSLADWWFIVDSLAAITVSACSYLVEERAVDFVHFCAIDFGESFGHKSNFYKGKSLIILIKGFSFYYGDATKKLRK